MVLLHGFEQGRLRFGGSTVYFIRQHHIGKKRPVDEAERSPAGGLILLQNVRAGDVRRHQVRGELDSFEAQIQDLAQGGNQQRLRQSRHAFQQSVAAAKNRDQHLLHHFMLPHDDATQFFLHSCVNGVQLLHLGTVIAEGSRIGGSREGAHE